MTLTKSSGRLCLRRRGAFELVVFGAALENGGEVRREARPGDGSGGTHSRDEVSSQREMHRRIEKIMADVGWSWDGTQRGLSLTTLGNRELRMDDSAL